MPSITAAKRTAIINAVQNASRAKLHDVAHLLKRDNFPSSFWLGKRNRYAIDTVRRITWDATHGPPKASQLSQYLAASIVLHCFDGWSFLSQSVRSLLNGDPATAVHLAYYAELRAAMSILASEGVGIFNSHHFWIDNAGTYHSLDGIPTHVVSWVALEEWANVPAKSARLLELFRINGISFDSWISAAGIALGSPSMGELAKDWLATWSLDLKEVGQDHQLRNVVSYRPQNMQHRSVRIDFTQTLSAISKFWKACEPSSANRFGVLDLHLLRQALQRTFRGRTATSPKGSVFTSFIKNTLTSLGIDLNLPINKFLLRSAESGNHVLLVEAKKKGQIRSGIIRPMSIIARALLLMRVATATTDDFLRQTSIDRVALEFWWKTTGAEIGLWPPGEEPGEMVDLWGSILGSLETLQAWCETNAASGSIFKVSDEHPLAMWQLNQFQRAGLWGIGL